MLEHMMKKTYLILFICASILTFSQTVDAQQNYNDLLKAIFKVKAYVPNDARTAKSLGTEREGNGVLIDTKGHILTIGYLILEAESVEVTISGGQTTAAVLVGYDHHSGFGLIKVKKSLTIQPVELGRSSELQEGALLLVASYGGKDAVQGVRIISRGVFTGYWEYLLENAIFSAPPISSFGGAALIGSNGRLVGIGSLYTQVVVEGLGSIPCNMFVPIDLLKPILEDLKTIGHSRKSPKPWLGFHAEETHGRVIVIRTTSDSPAEKAGIKSGDVILKVKGQPVNGLADFYRKVWSLGSAGIEVPLSVLQDTKIVEIKLISGDRNQYFQFKRKGTSIVLSSSLHQENYCLIDTLFRQ
jgi:S1-C subfamily serine protease